MIKKLIVATVAVFAGTVLIVDLILSSGFLRNECDGLVDFLIIFSPSLVPSLTLWLSVLLFRSRFKSPVRSCAVLGGVLGLTLSMCYQVFLMLNYSESIAKDFTVYGQIALLPLLVIAPALFIVGTGVGAIIGSRFSGD